MISAAIVLAAGGAVFAIGFVVGWVVRSNSLTLIDCISRDIQ